MRQISRTDVLLGAVLLLVVFGSSVQAATVAKAYQFSTKWETPGSADGQFFFPTGIAIDNAGSVYMVDNANERIQKSTFDGSSSSLRNGISAATTSNTGRRSPSTARALSTWSCPTPDRVVEDRFDRLVYHDMGLRGLRDG